MQNIFAIKIMFKKATIITYGCQMNVNDSAKVKKILENNNYEIVNDINNSNLIIINTCTVREGAAEKVYGKLGELKHLKLRKKNLIIGVIGCLAQEKKDEIYKKVRHVDFVLGNQNIGKIPQLLETIENEDVKHINYTYDEDKLPDKVYADFDSKITAYISITYGCNNFCTYCIVPYVRGRERSVPINEVIDEINHYLDKGYKEIYLLGQNVNSYGKGLDENVNFTDLLKEICKIDKKFRLRFMSPHPRDFTDELIEVIKNEDKICKNIHLPIQAGSTDVLKMMNRGYTKEEYLYLIEKIKNKIPDISLSTDIIVGFPNETDNNFNDTFDVVEQVEFDNSYMFMYSKRQGTPAATMDGQIDESEKKARLQKLIDLQAKKSKLQNEKYIGKIVEVLVEGPTPKNPENYSGRTDENKIVILKSDQKNVGEFVKVKIYDAKTWTLYGKII